MPYQTKDPADIDDVGFDWTDWLAGDSINASVWAVTGPDAALVIDSDSFSGAITKALLSGGTHLAKYAVSNTVTKTGGRDKSQTAFIVVNNPE